MTPEERRAYFKQWRAKKKAQGLCGECFQRAAGGPNGTRDRCGLCAERNRNRNIIRYYRDHPNRSEPIADRVMVVLGKRKPPKPSHVTWLELSAGRSNT